MRTLKWLVAMCALVVAVAAASAADKMDSAMFVANASQDGMTEIKAADVALAKGQDPKILDLARHLKTDHTKAADRLKAIAGKHGMAVASAVDSKHQKLLDDLNAKSGDAFDSAYRQEMVSAHEDAIKLFEEASKSGAVSTDLKSFATETLPTLKSHLAMARALMPLRVRDANSSDAIPPPVAP